MRIEFFVPGIPATAGSKTGFYNKKAKRVIMAPANKRQKPWMESVKEAALEVYKGDPLTCAVRLEIVFFMPRPRSHFGTGKNSERLKDSSPLNHTKKPDLTKMLRAVEDALTAIVWKDDAQVHNFSCRKVYTQSTPGAGVTIKTENSPLTNEPLQRTDEINVDVKFPKGEYKINIFDQI